MVKNGQATTIKRGIKGLKDKVDGLKIGFEELGNKFEDLKTDVLNMKVEILGELKNMREEFSAHQYSHKRVNDEIQDHEKRIQGLESAKN